MAVQIFKLAHVNLLLSNANAMQKKTKTTKKLLHPVLRMATCINSVHS